MLKRQLIMMEGPAGSGKSTLAEALVAHLRSTGTSVDHLPEEAIFTRPEFAQVGQAFRTKNFPTTDLILTAYRRTFRAAATTDSSIIADWNAVGMIEDLPCAQPDRVSVTSNAPSATADASVLAQHAEDVRNEWASDAILLLLRLPSEQAVQRAAKQRGRTWIDREKARWPTKFNSSSSLANVARLHQAYEYRRDALVEAYRAAAWKVVELDASRTEAAVLADATALAFPYA